MKAKVHFPSAFRNCCSYAHTTLALKTSLLRMLILIFSVCVCVCHTCDVISCTMSFSPSATTPLRCFLTFYTMELAVFCTGSLGSGARPYSVRSGWHIFNAHGEYMIAYGTCLLCLELQSCC